MTSKVLAEILTEHGGFDRDGDTFSLPSGPTATIFASLGQHSLIIERVAKVSLGAEVLVVSTRRSETFVVAHEDVRALRFGTQQTGIRPPGL